MGGSRLNRYQFRHKSIKVTMDLYGHLFPDQDDRVARALDDVFRTAEQQVAARPTKKARVVPLA